ncbi:MAG: 30S ribosomal protein S6 [Myxococcota bacterium]
MSGQSAENSTMRQYETLYILRPELDEETSCGLMRNMKEWVEQQGGKNVQVLCWGRKKLAWPRHDLRKGLFVQHSYVGKPGIVKSYERQLDVDERVLLRQTLTLKQQVDLQQVQELPDRFAPVKDSADAALQAADKEAFKRSENKEA